MIDEFQSTSENPTLDKIRTDVEVIINISNF